MEAEKQLWELALADYKKKMKRKDIAAKYGVSENTVKSWQSRHWNKKKGAPKNRKKGAPKPPGKPGAPKGNRNALGNTGGAPPGNQNGLKNGLYSELFLNTLTAEEAMAYASMGVNPKEMLEHTIKLYTIRELKFMRRIQELEMIEERNKPPGERRQPYTILRFHRGESKKDPIKEELLPPDLVGYPMEPDYKLSHEKGGPDYIEKHRYRLTTETVNNIELIGRFEAELSRLQRYKASAIAQYQRLIEQEGGEGSGRMDELMAALDESRELMGVVELDDSGNPIGPQDEAVNGDG